jgi:hypothetical protein
MFRASSMRCVPIKAGQGLRRLTKSALVLIHFSCEVLMKRRRLGLYRGSGKVLAHPDSPAGGTGPGFSRPPGPSGLHEDMWGHNSLPHPDSPAGRRITIPTSFISIPWSEQIVSGRQWNLRNPESAPTWFRKPGRG